MPFFWHDFVPDPGAAGPVKVKKDYLATGIQQRAIIRAGELLVMGANVINSG